MPQTELRATTVTMTDLNGLPGPGSVLSISHILTHFTDEVTGTEKRLGHLCIQMKVLTFYKSLPAVVSGAQRQSQSVKLYMYLGYRSRVFWVCLNNVFISRESART